MASNQISYLIKCLVVFFMLSMFVFVPNITLSLLILFILFTGVKNKTVYMTYVGFVLVYLSFVLSTKTLNGMGNDYITYFYNVQTGVYPSWTDDITDFFFWYIASFFMHYISGDNNALFFFLINLISFFPLIYFFNFLWRHLGKEHAVKIASLFFILLIPSFSFWNLFGNYIRQAWVFTFALGTLVAFLDKKYFIATLFAVATLTSHSSGIVFIVGVGFSYICFILNLNKMLFCAMIFCLVFTFLPVFNLSFSYLPTNFSSKLDFYSSWNGLNFGKTATLRLMASCICVYLINQFIIKDDEKYNLLYSRIILFFIYLMIIASILSGITKVVERLYYPIVVLFFMILCIQYSFFIRYLNSHSRTIAGVIFLLFGIPCLMYSLHLSLSYNESFYNGSMIDFFSYSFIEYL